MSFEKASEFLKNKGFADRIKEFEVSSATVELAAKALGCEEEKIAKTMAFDLLGETILILTAGDVKVDNRKFKDTFFTKAKMVPFDETEERIGHAPGGVCPFGVNEGVKVYLDESLKRFELVYPACGSSNSAVELSIDELCVCSDYLSWVDVCKMK